MTISSVDAIARSVEKTNMWINDLKIRLGWSDDHAVYEALRVTLMTIRDRVTPTEAAHLSAQLPLVLRGAFYDHYRPTDVPTSAKSLEDMLEPIRAHFSQMPNADPETIFRGVLDVMALHCTLGALDNVRSQMPKAVQQIWPPAAAA